MAEAHEKNLGELEVVQALSRGFLGDTERCPTATKRSKPIAWK